MTIREYLPTDILQVTQLFYNTVHSVNLKDYTSAEVDVWAPPNIDKEIWNDRLIENFTLVAEKDGQIIGFASLKHSGYYDLLYIHKDFQGQGVASFLTDMIEEKAMQYGFSELMADVSITAKPFFEKKGYEVLKRQTIERKGQFLTNYKMRKAFV